ncbi:MAG: hypothetical protein ACK58L_13085 [Planctomycetota bacterium]
MRRIILTALLALTLTTTCAFATDFRNVRSGLLLGIYAAPNAGGMQVTGIIPGYSAEGRLFSGDILRRTTVDGLTIYSLRSTYEIENAKSAIGPNRMAAVEIERPGIGLIYAWVEFTPIVAPAYSAHAATPVQSKAMFQMESERPGARAMFQRNMEPQPAPVQPGFGEPGDRPAPQPFVPGSDQSAENLFGRGTR